MPKNFHPTKQKLIDTALELLKEHPAADITSEQVLQISGISSGSLYHHFRDFPDLIDHALVARFAKYVDRSIELITNALVSSRTKEEYRAAIHGVTVATQGEGALQIRSDRVEIMAQAVRRPALRELLAEEQQRLTGALADLVRESQHRGWAKETVDPNTVAVFIQAYTVGFLVNDLSTQHVPDATWIAFIDAVVDAVLFT